ncbi:MAG: response regulator, partial [Proteobacteria bacterium]
IMMPSMTGLQALVEIRKNPKHGKLRVMFSSASREPAAEKTWQDFLSKPFDIDELIARVKKHCA